MKSLHLLGVTLKLSRFIPVVYLASPHPLTYSTFTMPKSKRAKVVHTSKTQKKGKELSLRLYANIQECITQYPYLYVFSVYNMRNQHLKDVRTQLSDSRLVSYPTRSNPSLTAVPKLSLLPSPREPVN